MGQYEDGSMDIYTCPYCQEEYTVFGDMVDCYKSHYPDKED